MARATAQERGARIDQSLNVLVIGQFGRQADDGSFDHRPIEFALTFQPFL
jgi:hypothetical protein